MQGGLLQKPSQFTNGIINTGGIMHRITVVENFISPEDAKTLIDEQLNPSEVNEYPKYYSKRFGGTSLPYNKIVQDIMIKYGHKANQMHKELNGFKNDIYVFKAFGSHWATGTKGDLHIDAQGPEPWIEFSTIIYLNFQKILYYIVIHFHIFLVP